MISKDIFAEISCLTEQSTPLNGLTLNKEWFGNGDKRYLGQTLQKFISYNRIYFEFLGITPTILGFDQKVDLSFKSTAYIGSIPLIAPHSGKQISDLLVIPRLSNNANYADLLSILDKIKCYIQPEFKEGLYLKSKISAAPQLSYEIVKYINLLLAVSKYNWVKFVRVERNSNDANGLINWPHYINHLNNLYAYSTFPMIKNSLSKRHWGLSELKYVYEVCKEELKKTSVISSKWVSIKNTIRYLDSQLDCVEPLTIDNIRISVSDAQIVKDCKMQANIILKKQFSQRQPWRIDFAQVFEKFVQYIFDEMAKEAGISTTKNFKFHKRGSKSYTWELNYLEPDMMIYMDKLYIVIDAKYKSNLYNKHSTSQQLKDDFRLDLHQIFAYSAFLEQKNKIGILCYPSTKYESKFNEYINRKGNVQCVLGLIGIPFTADLIRQTIIGLKKDIEMLFKQKAA